MCGTTFQKNTSKKAVKVQYEVERPTLPPNTYAHIFREHQRHAVLQWVVRMNRLTEDPFFSLMESTSNVRWWMVRNTPWPPEDEHLLNGGTILAYFENMGRERALRYFRTRRAPSQVIRIWEATYPAAPPSDTVAQPTTLDEVVEESND